MDDVRVGAVVRLLRRRVNLNQQALARRARVSPTMVSRIERGDIDRTSLAGLRRIFVALGARIDLVPRWQGADVDRLLDARHAALAEVVLERLARLPEWITQAEVTFSIYGERGSIDIVAWHPARKALLIIEIKSVVGDVGGLMRQVDRYRRLAREVARQRRWAPRTVSVWVVVEDNRTARRRLQEHRSIQRGAFPVDGHGIDRWLLAPDTDVAALSFMPVPHVATIRRHRTG